MDNYPDTGGRPRRRGSDLPACLQTHQLPRAICLRTPTGHRRRSSPTAPKAYFRIGLLQDLMTVHRSTHAHGPNPGMNAFKLRRFHALVILQCVRWYSKYTIRYRQLEEMMAERGVVVDHTTIWRWIQRYAPQLEKEVRWYQGHTGGSWRVDETCILVNGEWKWLFRAVDKQGRTVDFLLTHRRNAKAARRFLAKALGSRQDWPPHAEDE